MLILLQQKAAEIIQLKVNIAFIHKGRRKKKSLLLLARPLRGGEGVKGRAIMVKNTFFYIFFQRSKILTAIKLEGGRGVRP